MTEGLPDRLVFDTEPLVAYFCDEKGSDAVEKYLTAVEGSTEGYISAVNLAEVHYVVRAIDSKERADTVTDILEESGLSRIDTEETWPLASEYKARHAIALGDAFAVATANSVDGTLLVGADDDYEEITSVPIERFRTEPAV